MKKFKFMRKFLFSLVFIVAIFGCASTGKSKDTILIEHPERMFWEIKKGDASVFVLGTIHAADKRFYPLEENVLKAFDSADRLVSELGTLDQDSMAKETAKYFLEDMNLDREKHLQNFLTDVEQNYLVTTLGKQVEGLYVFDPWILTLMLTQISLEQAGINHADGIDYYLMDRAKTQKRNIEALETIEFQLNLFREPSFDQQLELLKETLAGCIKGGEKATGEELKKLMQFYLDNNRAELGKHIYSRDVPEGLSPKTHKAFTDKMFKNRNIDWAKKFYKYLNEGGKTFVFAGAGHFVGDESVFKQMGLE
ncbi:MAG: TraB/GumN family protein [Treponemataceae bacterium]